MPSKSIKCYILENEPYQISSQPDMVINQVDVHIPWDNTFSSMDLEDPKNFKVIIYGKNPGESPDTICEKETINGAIRYISINMPPHHYPKIFAEAVPLMEASHATL